MGMLHTLGAVALGSLSLGAAPLAPNSTRISTAVPPVRYHGDNAAIVIFTDNVEAICGKAPEGYRILACQWEKDGVPYIALPNPCPVAAEGQFARLACHELGHRNGWVGTHGD